MFTWRCLFRKGKTERTIKAQRDTRAEIRISANFHKSWMVKQGWEIIMEKLTDGGKMVYFIDHEEATIGFSKMDATKNVCKEQQNL